MTLRATVACFGLSLATCAFAQGSDPRETSPFVLSYRCDGGDTVAVAYPAFRDAQKAPIQLSWDGKRYRMYLARSASGARYVTRDSQLQWWTSGHGAFLAVPGVQPPILNNCQTF